jgi:hypothetical protein
MLERLFKLFAITLIFEPMLFASGDLSPKYVRLFTGDDGKGIWQMVGVAGFYNNIYGVEYEDEGSSNFQKYTSFYCEEDVEGSVIRTKYSDEDDLANDMNGTLWLFSVKVEEAIGDLSPLVVDITSSSVSCANTQRYSSGFGDGYTGIPVDKFIYMNNNPNNEIAIFKYPIDISANLVFSLNYDPDRIYEITLSSSRDDVWLDSADYPASTNEEYMQSINEAKQPIVEIVDLYLNDNPGFGSSDSTMYDNINRDPRDYTTSNHQVPIFSGSTDDERNVLDKYGNLRIYSHDSINNRWLDFHSKNEETNEFSELQAGKGYWMKYDVNVSQENQYIKTLELNDSLGSGVESNLTFSVNSEFKASFVNSNVDYIADVLNCKSEDSSGNTISNKPEYCDENELNISVTEIADNSILVIATSEEKPTVKENTSGKNVFLNISTLEHSFWETQEIKAGLVLGDTSVTIESQAVYSSIAQKGWNLLTLPTSTIRKSVTGIIFNDWNESLDDLTISDNFGVNSATVISSSVNGGRTASEAAQAINSKIAEAISLGDFSTQSFNVRAFAIGNSDNSLLLIASDKFLVSSSTTLPDATNLIGEDISLNNKGKFESEYGNYALFVQPNVDSQFTQDGVSNIVVTGISIIEDVNETIIENLSKEITFQKDSTLSSIVEDINSSYEDTNVFAIAVDTDFDGLIDDGDYVMLTSDNTFSIQDTTYTRVYKYIPNSDGDLYVDIYNGTGAEAVVLAENIQIQKDTNISSSSFIDKNNTTLGDQGEEVSLNLYVVDENGSTIEGNQTEYIVTASNSPSLILRERVVSNSILDDSLSHDFDFNHTIMYGAIRSGYQAHDLASVEIVDGKVPVVSTLNNITSNIFSTDDLLASNSLITLSKAFSGTEKYIPTMIIGSESDVDTDRIYWKSLSPVRQLDKWYKEYNLFSTHNQKAYWVYLDEYPEENPIDILDTPEPSVTKKYIRVFNNETGEVHNYFNLNNISATVKGIDSELSGYVVANLNGISELEDLDFKLEKSTAPEFNGENEFFTSIQYFEVEGMNNNLESITLTATDGRLYTDETTIDIDVKKPSKPVISFENGENIESTKLYITSGDNGTAKDDTVQYMIFQDRINDVTGIDFDTIDEPNFIMDVDKATGTAGVDELCPNLTLDDTLDYFSLVIVALDSDDTTQANVSDMSKINFIPMKDVHVLIHDEDSDSDEDLLPTHYDETCTNIGSYLSDEGATDSGVDLTSYNTQTTLTYKPIPGVTRTTTIPITMYFGTQSVRIGKIRFPNSYLDKYFFVYNSSKLYRGVFSKDCELQDSYKTKSQCQLERVFNSGQKIGEE